jgi:hypothetical protein
VVYALHHQHQGHIHQFIRAIVTHTMNHEPQSDVAMTTWLHQTVLFKNNGSSFEVKKPLPTTRGRAALSMANWQMVGIFATIETICHREERER